MHLNTKIHISQLLRSYNLWGNEGGGADKDRRAVKRTHSHAMSNSVGRMTQSSLSWHFKHLQGSSVCCYANRVSEHVRLGTGWRMVTDLKATLDQRGDALQPLSSADYIQAGSHSWGWVDLHLSEVFNQLQIRSNILSGKKMILYFKILVYFKTGKNRFSSRMSCQTSSSVVTELSMLNTDSLCNHNWNLLSNSIKSNKQHVTGSQD